MFFLRACAEIEHTKRTGRRRQTPYFNLVSCASSSSRTRIGIIVGKRLGTAVVRNRAKRIFRELARQVRGDLAAGQTLLVFPRREALTHSSASLRRLWIETLQHEGLIKKGAASTE